MIIKRLIDFWEKYEKRGMKLTLIILSLQIVHLFWLTTNVVLARIVTNSLAIFPKSLYPILISVDYIEMPGIIAGTTFYAFNAYKNKDGSRIRNLVLMSFLAVHVYHTFWITDDVVYQTFSNTVPVPLPFIATWFAILVDYLELPVIADLLVRIFRSEKK